MHFIGKWKIIIAGLLIFAISLATFFVTGSLLNSATVAGQDEEVQRHFRAATLEEASNIVGYTVATPAFIPTGFKKQMNITVDKPMGNSQMRVTQIWSSGDKYPFLCLIQDPSLDGIGGGEPVEVEDFRGVRLLSKANGDIPTGLTLFWREGNTAFLLVGTMTGELDEETIYRIAESVE